jgi:hypothetical protein
MLLTLRTSQQQIEAQAQAISAASVTALSAHQATIAAQVQVYQAVKASVLGAAFVSPSSSLVTPEVTEQPQGSLQIVHDYSHLPIVAVMISDAAVLERLRANPNVISVEANLIARTANTKTFNLVGQPVVAASGYWGVGNTAVTIDTGMAQGSSVSLGLCCRVWCSLSCGDQLGRCEQEVGAHPQTLQKAPQTQQQLHVWPAHRGSSC